MISFKKFEEVDKSLLTTWLSNDDLGQKFLSSYRDTDEYIHLIDFKRRYLWIVIKENNPVGFFDFEIENTEKGYFVFYVAPDYRNTGLGEIILKTALKIPEIKQVKILEGGVEKDNIISIKILEKLGFLYDHEDEDHMLMYQIKTS